MLTPCALLCVLVLIAMLFAFKFYHKPHFTVAGSWNKSLRLQHLQRCYCENSRSPASTCVMRHHYSITYTQSVHGINDLIALGRVGNLLYMFIVNLNHLLIIIYYQSVLPKGSSFTANSGTKTAVLPKAGLPSQTHEPRLRFYQG